MTEENVVGVEEQIKELEEDKELVKQGLESYKMEKSMKLREKALTKLETEIKEE